MRKGPKGERRPGDVIGAAIMVGRIATGEIQEGAPSKKSAAGRLGGKKGGTARASNLTAEQRSEAAAIAAQARWRRKT
jgi:hypothetical protein